MEDASHAHGAGAAGRPAGSFGDISCLSLHASKTLPAGEGGLIVTDDEQLHTRLWRAHDLGRDPGAEPYAYSSAGGNHRIAEVSARLAIHGLGRLDEANRRRHSAALELREATAELAGIDVQPLAEGVDLHARHLLVVRYDREACAGPSRRRFELALCAEGIPCYGGWPDALTSLPFLRRAGGEHPPVPWAERATGDSLWIDSRLLLEERGPAQVAEALRKVSRLSGSLGGRRAPGSL